jgi:hypothetical protein
VRKGEVLSLYVKVRRRGLGTMTIGEEERYSGEGWNSAVGGEEIGAVLRNGERMRAIRYLVCER